MEIFLVVGAVINTLLTGVSVLCVLRIEKKNAWLDLNGPGAIASLHSQLRQHDADLDDVYDRLKRHASRKGMQALREERSSNPFAKLPTETDSEWKARARKLRNNGVEPSKE